MTQKEREERERERGSVNCPFGNLARWRDIAEVHWHRQHFGHRNERALIASRPLLTHAGDMRFVSRRVEETDETWLGRAGSRRCHAEPYDPTRHALRRRTGSPVLKGPFPIRGLAAPRASSTPSSLL